MPGGSRNVFTFGRSVVMFPQTLQKGATNGNEGMFRIHIHLSLARQIGMKVFLGFKTLQKGATNKNEGVFRIHIHWRMTLCLQICLKSINTG